MIPFCFLAAVLSPTNSVFAETEETTAPEQNTEEWDPTAEAETRVMAIVLGGTTDSDLATETSRFILTILGAQGIPITAVVGPGKKKDMEVEFTFRGKTIRTCTADDLIECLDVVENYYRTNTEE